MKALIILAIATMGLNLFAQNPRLDRMADQMAQDIKSRMENKVSVTHLQTVSIKDDCHDVSNVLTLNFGVEERITYEMSSTGIESIDFDYVADCERFSNFLTLNGAHGLSKLEIDRKLDEITASRKAKNAKKSQARAWRKATEKFPSGPKL